MGKVTYLETGISLECSGAKVRSLPRGEKMYEGDEGS